jgi:HSP20 family protein
MDLRDLIPWGRGGRDLEVRRREESNPFPRGPDVDVRPREDSNPLSSLQHEIDRVLENAFRGFDLMPFGSDRAFDRAMDLPNMEVTETDTEVKVTAEVPGLEEKDLQVEVSKGVLAIKGEKKSETKDASNYSRFERRIAIDDVDEDNVAVTFKNGVLTVTLRKTGRAQKSVGFI